MKLTFQSNLNEHKMRKKWDQEQANSHFTSI
jgi:hypothetical protein